VCLHPRPGFVVRSLGHQKVVNVSDLVGLPIKAGTAMSHRRFFHPSGVLASGSIERLAPPGDGLPISSSEVVGRVSKGAGLPGGLPDVAGLAWRMPPGAFAPTPWDVLLASAGAGKMSRFALRPALSWSAVSMSSLMPLRYRDQHWWVGARLVTDVAARWLSLQDMADHITEGDRMCWCTSTTTVKATRSATPGT
jgi:hypothetical protein